MGAMIEPQFRRQQLDLLVRAANQIDCGRLAPEVRREVTSLLKLLLMECAAATVMPPAEIGDE
ncbi:MAG: hypothetical protein ACXW3P_04030 [Rhodospirillales bacterium]|jgi:hypothetical protein